MESSKPYTDGMKTKKSFVDFELLKKLSANGIKIKPSLLKFYKKFSIFLSFLFLIFVSAEAQTELKSFHANFTGMKVKLYWKTKTENNSNYFSVERSWNGKNFEVIGLVKATGNTTAGTDYSFIDKEYYSNVIYYCLKMTDRNGKEKLLGNIVAIQITEDVKEISIYPITNLPGAVYVDVSKLPGEQVIVDAIDAEGQKVASKKLNKTLNDAAFAMQTFYLLQKGEYSLIAFYDNQVLKSKLKVYDASLNFSENNTSVKNQVFTLK